VWGCDFLRVGEGVVVVEDDDVVVVDVVDLVGEFGD